jgi:hypothetical protein
MKLPWFKRFGLFHLPVSLVGYIILLAAVAYAVYIFIDIDSRSHSVSDTMMNFVFNLLIIGVIYTIIGFITSARKEKQR